MQWKLQIKRRPGPPEKRMLIDAAEREESRIAVVESGLLQELYIERRTGTESAGNIYKGTVLNIEPAIQAAFVDFGGRRNGFLHASDVTPNYKDTKTPLFAPIPAADRRAGHKVKDHLKPGQEVVVQVTREGLRSKGPGLTTYLSLPGRYLVLMPGVNRRTISRKISDEKQRQRLKKIIDDFKLPGGLGLILRTAGEGRTRREIERDLDYLLRLWKVLARRIRRAPAPYLIYQESDVVTRVIRDVFTSDTKQVVINSEPVYRKTLDFMKAVMPRYRGRLKLYSDLVPLFDKSSVEQQIDLAVARTVPLKSGGSIVIEQTEALVAIDVNSGKYLAGADAEETAFKTNIEAAAEIARQIRLRDLGGVIINDFIDMEVEEHRRHLEQEFAAALKRDRARIRVARMSRFGMIEMTRQRVRVGLVMGAYEHCERCNGRGILKTVQATAVDAIRRIKKEITSYSPAEMLVRLSPEVATYIYNFKRDTIAQIEHRSRKSVRVIADPSVKRGEIVIKSSSTDRSSGGRKR